VDDETTEKKEFVGYIKSLGVILPFRAAEGEKGIGLVQSQELSAKNVSVHGQKWETCRWMLGQTLLHIVCHSQNITII
jgi:hypothetical protein